MLPAGGSQGWFEIALSDATKQIVDGSDPVSLKLFNHGSRYFIVFEEAPHRSLGVAQPGRQAWRLTTTSRQATFARFHAASQNLSVGRSGARSLTRG